MNNPINILNNKIDKSDGSIEEMQYIFYHTANDLMNCYILKIDHLEFELTEIEFYYFNCEKHSDIYVHLHDLQKNTNTFIYAHESWGKYGGVDLTFGNKKYYGGILIRGIRLNEKYIAGPANVRNTIVEEISQEISSYPELQDYFNKNKAKIMLIPKDTTQYNILHAPRHNLGKKDHKKFKNALYRFVRVDYLVSEKRLFSGGSKSNLKDISMLKSITKMTLKYECNEPSTIKKIEDNYDLKNKIEAFKDKYYK
ncbi:MAG: hypothetical protein PHO65_04445 [Sulfurovum sp.]|nr:hypothetical protein [Sulfurovum sp.]